MPFVSPHRGNRQSEHGLVVDMDSREITKCSEEQASSTGRRASRIATKLVWVKMNLFVCPDFNREPVHIHESHFRGEQISQTRSNCFMNVNSNNAAFRWDLHASRGERVCEGYVHERTLYWAALGQAWRWNVLCVPAAHAGTPEPRWCRDQKAASPSDQSAARKETVKNMELVGMPSEAEQLADAGGS